MTPAPIKNVFSRSHAIINFVLRYRIFSSDIRLIMISNSFSEKVEVLLIIYLAYLSIIQKKINAGFIWIKQSPGRNPRPKSEKPTPWRKLIFNPN